MRKIGEWIDGFKLTRKMSHSVKTIQVFAAHHPKTNTYVAIKTFDKTDPISQEHFNCEVQILKKLNHPNIVHFINAGQDEDIFYLVTEFLEGVALNRITPKNKGLPFQTVWPFVLQIGLGLEAIHQAKIAHLDLKPSNILLTHQQDQSPLIKIIDFDIAQKISKNWKDSAHKPWGTPGYIAPERILKNTKPDIRSDIYSLGAILAFLLTGQRPFEGETAEQVLAKQLENLPDVLPASFLGEFHALQEIITKAMHQNPDGRYQNVSEMMLALQSISTAQASN